MFGGNVTSSWATPQQNQQQQQQTGAFGQPAGGFGTSAFGNAGTSAFGQPAQQPQANPMFGNLGAPATNTNTGFGAFGGTNTSQSNTTNPMFGGAKPSTGFGAFGGGTSAFGGGGTFGQTNTASGSGTGAFGQPATATATSAFGTGNSIFGASKPAPTAFGTTTTSSTTAPPVTTGSSNPPYAIHTEKDPSSANVTLHYQSISCMPAYANTSVEVHQISLFFVQSSHSLHQEIRLQDYNQGRKTASTFGPGAFGATQTATGTGLFGAQPAQQTSAFGAPATNTGGFGAFGVNNTTPATTSAFGGGSAFGQPQQQQQTAGFGAFGSTTQQPQQQQTGGGLFGGGGGGAFGSTASKPFGAFGGGTATAANAFGGGGGGGAFGQNQQQQTQPTGGLFGSTNNTTSTTNAFGSFGNNNANKSVFGQTNTTQPTTGFGAFGSTQPQQNQQQQQTNPLFGGGTGIFGQQQQPQQQQGTQQPASNPLFGGGQTGNTGGLFGGGGGLFGNNNNQQQQQQAQQPAQTGAFGAFGAKPAQPTGGLFGGGTFGQSTSTNTTQPANPLFGSTLGGQQNNQTTAGGGLFGKPAPALGASTSTSGGGLFGSTNPTSGLFNTSTTAPGAQGTLTASISEPIGSDLPIFNLLPPGPRLLDLDTSQKKKPGFFVDVPTRSPMPRVGYTPANSKLRGFGASFSSPAPSPSPLTGSLSLNSSKTSGLSLSRAADNSSSFDAFLLGRSSSPALGSGTKQSVKKVILDKKVEPTEIFVKSGGSPGGLRGGKVVFSPALSAASREKDAQAALNPTDVTESPTPRPKNTPNRFTAQSQPSAEEDGQGRELEDGEYYVKPDLATLKQKGYDELSSFDNLVVGRVGFGEIQFLEPVDLTGLPKLGALLGEVIRFDEKECSVYPESDDVDKPPPGSGLNVAARLSLLNCWAVDKATREPIKDESHPSASKHLKRLKKISNTHFESFDITDGKWTFKVDHF
ncbi:hypothetical protein C0995_011138 [Termitomyces sp. Mi166|nr:hypothetical protein C0995_011138 [Termitomyces sp. Mi166\